MEDFSVMVINGIYREIKFNIDVVKEWFKIENLKLDVIRLFSYQEYDFSPIIGGESDIYVFFNKLISNISHGVKFEFQNLTYLESNFVSIYHIVMDKLK